MTDPGPAKSRLAADRDETVDRLAGLEREFAAIVNPPQSTILAVGAGRRAPRETASSRIEFYDVMTVTLSCDHRVVDGALSAELLAVFKSIIEHPVSAIA